MQQQTVATVTFEPCCKSTRRERCVDEIKRLVSWADMVAAIEPVYPKTEGLGRSPVGVEQMRRPQCLQQWFNLPDQAVEEALYDSRAMRQFVGIDLSREPVPDGTTICRFRHLLEPHQLGQQTFARIGESLTKQELQGSGGTIVDATIISAPVRRRIARRWGIRKCIRRRKGTCSTLACRHISAWTAEPR